MNNTPVHPNLPIAGAWRGFARRLSDGRKSIPGGARAESHGWSRADAWLRIGGCAAAIITAGSMLAGSLAAGQHPVALTSVTFIGVAGFLSAFWAAMKRGERGVVDRRTHVLLATQAVIGLLVNQELMYLVALELPLVLPLQRARGWAIGMVLALTAGVAVNGALVPEAFVASEGLSHLPFAWQVALTAGAMVGWMVFAFCGGCLAASERRSRRELARANAEMAVAHQLLAHGSRLDERVRISRDLHDTLGHSLTALRLHLDIANRLPADRRIAEPIAQAREIAGAMLEDVRAVVSTLRAERPIDLGDALRRMVSQVVAPAVHLALPEDLVVESAAQAHVVFRTVQEAITNAIRHARAANVWIALADRGGVIELTVRDDGQGAQSIAGGHGLAGMRERLREVRGSLTIDSQPGQGFALQVRVPAGAGAAR